MARSKSISGSKTSRASEKKEQNGAGTPASLPELNPPAETMSATPPPTKVVHETGGAPQVRVTVEPKTASEAKVAPEPKAALDARKFEVMKTDGRKNLVPINLEDEIRRRAYELYQERGSHSGSEAEDWLNAEREVQQRYRQQSA